MNSRNPTPIIACTARTRARSAGGRLRPNSGDRGAEQRQDEHPQEHRALVVAPYAAHFVEQRLHAVRVRRDVGEREVGDDIGVRQREVRDRDEQELRQRRRPRPGGQGRVASGRADQRHDGLQRGDAQRQDQRKMPDFGDHSGSIGAEMANLKAEPCGTRISLRSERGKGCERLRDTISTPYAVSVVAGHRPEPIGGPCR